MKNIISKLCLLAGIFMASVQVSQAISVSSQTNVLGAGPTSIIVKRGESISYVINSTGALAGVHTATVSVQYSLNAQNWINEVTTAPTANAFWKVADALPIKSGDTYYRFFVSGSSGGAVVITLYDNDDFVGVTKNNKGADVVSSYDESLRIAGSIMADKTQYQLGVSSPILMISSNTAFQWNRVPPADKVWLGGPSVFLDKSFQIITSTAGFGGYTGAADQAFTNTLSARPIISTITANNGDVVAFECHSSSITFTDNSSAAGSALKLGATTRSCGNNDFIEFMYYNGFWRETRFVDNRE